MENNMEKTTGKQTVETDIPTKEKRAFGIRDLFGYFMGDFGCNMSFTLINSYMFIFFTQYIGISLGHYAIIILISKILDGINDPIVGAIVDKMGADNTAINSNNGFLSVGLYYPSLQL